MVAGVATLACLAAAAYITYGVGMVALSLDGARLASARGFSARYLADAREDRERGDTARRRKAKDSTDRGTGSNLSDRKLDAL